MEIKKQEANKHSGEEEKNPLIDDSTHNIEVLTEALKENNLRKGFIRKVYLILST